VLNTMKSEAVWTDRIPERDNARSVVYSICFKPDGSQALFAVGNRILVYGADNGTLIHSLKAHKDAVYALAYCRDGTRFASGSADKTVVIWTDKYQPLLRYTHNESIQCVAFSAGSKLLASATSVDFGLWSPDQKNVQKYKVAAKVMCMAWTHDGQYVALGQFNGHISIRDKSGAEKVRIERSAPIWSIAFSPPPKDGVVGAASGSASNGSGTPPDQLAVACWDETLSFYTLSGQPVGREQKLDFYPCALSWYEDGEYLAMGGSDRKLSLYSKEGTFLKTICERDDWVWSTAARPGHKQLVRVFVALSVVGDTSVTSSRVCACRAAACRRSAVMTDRSLCSPHVRARIKSHCSAARYRVTNTCCMLIITITAFNTVHGLFSDRYAHRETMTDVVLQHLITDQKIRVRCKDLVKKIAVYRCVRVLDAVPALLRQTDHDHQSIKCHGGC